MKSLADESWHALHPLTLSTPLLVFDYAYSPIFGLPSSLWPHYLHLYTPLNAIYVYRPFYRGLYFAEDPMCAGAGRAGCYSCVETGDICVHSTPSLHADALECVGIA